jgi:uncharacterized C2H2 Zn-finger protein
MPSTITQAQILAERDRLSVEIENLTSALKEKKRLFDEFNVLSALLGGGPVKRRNGNGNFHKKCPEKGCPKHSYFFTSKASFNRHSNKAHDGTYSL